MLLLLLQNSERIKLNGITFLDMRLNVQKVGQIDTSLNERKNISKCSFGSNVENAKVMSNKHL